MAATIDTSNAVQASKKKHLGIPEAIFVEDVDSFMKKPGNETADSALRKLDEQHQKYKYMELNLSQKKLRLKSQIPQISQTLEILRHMQKKKDTKTPMDTHFLLADNVYCKASVPPTDKVCLWLGANVMLLCWRRTCPRRACLKQQPHVTCRLKNIF
ncbi:prefoldin subunit 3 [Notothenia coriiceps]|uniref:Prefoldin subunit 3 n=1 Tax=Notothenia coriiceps TaxID=8208 RepID=A0A6I9NGW8_9TELE|nr:PREDICTED: prefoldin subunit 3 [Notothenia coriiceps]